MAQAEFDPQNLSPEQFVQLVQTADDAQIVEAIHSAGTERSLEQIFIGMVESYKGGNDDADIQWGSPTTGPRIAGSRRFTKAGPRRARATPMTPKVTLTTDLVSFVKMIAGVANGTSLFMSGKLKLMGDMMFAMKIESMFERPS
jgi:hypothetical protein